MAWYSILSAQEASVGPTGVVPLPGYQGPAIKRPSPGAITSGSQWNRATFPAANPAGGLSGPVLTAGSDLDRAQIGSPWPRLLPSLYKLFNGWRRNTFHDWFRLSIPANYGSVTSTANFGFRRPEYDGRVPWEDNRSYGRYAVNNGIQAIKTAPVIGNYPGPVRTPYRPTFDILTPIVWRLQIVNPNQVTTIAGQSVQSLLTNPAEFPASATAALNTSGIASL